MRLPPAVLFAAAAAAQRLLTGRLSTPPSVLPALAVSLAAGAVGAGGVREFLRARTTFDPVKVDGASTLVTGGVLRFTRNPMYLALAGLLMAHAVARRSVVALLPVAGFMWVIDRWQIPAEEAALTSHFAEEYRDYRRRVPRWILPV